MIRQRLRAATRGQHELLDASLGEFRDVASYGTYLRNTDRFRAAVEPALRKPGGRGWCIVPLGIHIQADLADLDICRPDPVAPLRLDSASAVAGALYVIEGSALGSRVLARRAAMLGFADDFAARHLARQADEAGRWTRFLDWLDAIDADPEEAERGAQDVFAAALEAYGVAAPRQAAAALG